MDSLLTLFLTVTTGVLTLVLGQISIKLFVEPIQQQATVIGAIHHSLLFYRNRYTHMLREDNPQAQEPSKHLRDQAAQLAASTNAIHLYGLWARLKVMPPRKTAMEASKDLMELSYFPSGEVSGYEVSGRAAKRLKLDMF